MAVDKRHPLYDKYIDTWEKCFDAYEGQDSIKSKGSRYLPKLSGHLADTTHAVTADDRSRGKGLLQTESEYRLYLQRAIYYNYVKKICNGLNEQLFRKQVKINVPTALQPIVDVFTHDGKSLKTAVKESNKNIFLQYRDILVLDLPKVDYDAGPISQEEADQINIRPYAVYYRADQVINWNYEVINNRLELTRVIIEENVQEQDPDDEFGEVDILQYRVLDLGDEENYGRYRIRIFREQDGKMDVFGEEIYPMVRGNYLDYLPCYFLTQKGISDDLDYPMLNDAVDINIAHYINSADYENAINITGSPTPVVIGYDSQDDDEPISLGSSRALMLQGQNANAFYMEYKGQGPSAIASAMDKKVDALSVIASRMLQNDPKGIESAETAQIHRSAEQGLLASMALSLSEAYEIILYTIADWMGVTGEITVLFNTDYNVDDIDANLLSNLTMARQAGLISQYVYFYNLLKGEMIPDDWTVEKENAERANDMMQQGMLISGYDEEEEKDELEGEE